eukprot:jgi/Chrzof1/5840/Cz16g17230.t1
MATMLAGATMAGVSERLELATGSCCAQVRRFKSFCAELHTPLSIYRRTKTLDSGSGMGARMSSQAPPQALPEASTGYFSACLAVYEMESAELVSAFGLEATRFSSMLQLCWSRGEQLEQACAV